MYIQTNKIKDRRVKRFIGHIIYFLIVLVLIPLFFYFELCIVLPAVVEDWTFQIIHTLCATFLLLNIIGNMIYGIFTDTSIKGKVLSSERKNDWTFCIECETLRPPRSWHCDICDICILKRDHHCTFFACCIGYFNHRYFILFTLDIFIAMLYAFYFNIQFIARFITWNHGLALVKFLFPLANFVIDFGYESLYIFMVVINIIVGAFTGFLFFYHFNNILKGKITPEKKINKRDSIYDKGWKENLVEVFGYKWYLTWILPFISSQLPGDGTVWNIEHKHQ